MGIYVCKQGPGERGIYCEVSFFLPWARPQVALSLLSPWLSVYIPFLHLEIALRQEESEEKPSDTTTAAMLAEGRSPGGARQPGPRRWRGATRGGPDFPGAADIFSQAGRKLERSGSRNGEGVCRREPHTPWGTESAIISQRGNPPD